MTSVRLTDTARRRFNELLDTRPLPPAARDRLLRRLRQLERFPESGRPLLAGDWAGARVLAGPWWFVIVYVFDAATDSVVVTTIEDARMAPGSRARGD